MSVNLTDEQYLDLLLRGQKKAAPRRGGCGTVVTIFLMLAMGLAFVVLTANQLGYMPPAVLGPFVGTPQAVFSTPAPAVQPQPRYTPFYGAPAQEEAPVPAAVPAPAQEAPITNGSASGGDLQEQPAAAPVPKAAPHRVKEREIPSDKPAPGQGSYSGGAWGDE